MSMSASLPERGFDISLELDDGETLALLGPNGSGKSTALNVISGLLRPHSGEVRLDARTLTRVVDGRTEAWVPPHRRHIALLAQDPLLFPHLSACDNVAFGPRSQGESREAARNFASRLLYEVGVGDLASRRPSQLSGGQAQRVAIARALATDPRVLLLDEPLAALDVSVVPAIRQTLKQVLRGRSAIVVTHDALDALLLSDRVVVMEEGRIVEEGPSMHVLSKPRSAFAARIAGLNMIEGSWRDGVVEASAGIHVMGELSGPVPSPGEPAVAVFRPNAVAVYRSRPDGSPRNVFAAAITELEPRGDQIRVSAGELSADITAQAAAELDLALGTEAYFVVKATEIAVYRA